MLAPPPKTNLEFPKFPNSLPHVSDLGNSLNSLSLTPMDKIQWFPFMGREFREFRKLRNLGNVGNSLNPTHGVGN